MDESSSGEDKVAAPTASGSGASRSSVTVHRCRFVDYVPAAINALEFTPASYTTRTLLACARANGDIEIRSPADDWLVRRVIPGGAYHSIAALSWLHQNGPAEGDEDDEESETESEAFDDAVENVEMDVDGEQPAPKELRTLKSKYSTQHPRLISSGHNGLITEWDLDTLTPKLRLDSNGGAVWCLAPNPRHTILAVGCEDGMVRLFDISDGNLDFLRSTDRIDARLLSLTWSHDGSFIYAGSSDSCLRKYDAKSGRILHRTTVDRQKREDTLVWAVKTVEGGQIVAGTSLGSLHVVQGDTMTVVQTLRGIHAADILTLAVDPRGTTVYSAGVDRKIVQFRLVDELAGQRTESSAPQTVWIVAGERRWHSHDVRALALRSDKPTNALVNGGADTQLVSCAAVEFPNVAQKRLPSFPARPIVGLCKARRTMACRFGQSVRVWKLGNAPKPRTEEDEMVPENADLEGQGYRAVLEIQVSGGRNLTCGDMSADGRWIAVADVEETKLFSLDTDIEPVSAKKVPLDLDSGAHALAFTPDCRRLAVAAPSGHLHILDLETGAVLKTFEQHVGKGGVSMLAVSSDGQWLASVDGKGFIESFNLDSLQHHSTVPRFNSMVTAMSFHPTSHGTLVVACASNEFFLYQVEDRRFSDWTRSYGSELPSRLLNSSDRIVGIAFNPARPSTIVFWGITFFAQVDLDKPSLPKNSILSQSKRKRLATTLEKMAAEPTGDDKLSKEGKKIRKKHRHDHEKQEKQERRDQQRKKLEEKIGFAEGEEPSVEVAGAAQFIKIHRYQPLMFLDFVGEDEMVVVERPWFGILESLPPSFYRKSYGEG